MDGWGKKVWQGVGIWVGRMIAPAARALPHPAHQEKTKQKNTPGGAGGGVGRLRVLRQAVAGWSVVSGWVGLRLRRFHQAPAAPEQAAMPPRRSVPGSGTALAFSTKAELLPPNEFVYVKVVNWAAVG